MNFKKLLASVMAAATVMCATAVPAFAAADAGLTCSLCQNEFGIGKYVDGKTYEEVYNVPTLSGLTSQGNANIIFTYTKTPMTRKQVNDYQNANTTEQQNIYKLGRSARSGCFFAKERFLHTKKRKKSLWERT